MNRLDRKRYKKIEKNMQPLTDAKNETIHWMCSFGRKHKFLKYPILVLTIAFIFVYNAFFYLLLNLKLKEKIAKPCATFLTGMAVIAFISISVFASQDAENNQSNTASYYSVKFSYNNSTYTMDGNGTVNLQDLASFFGIPGNISYAVSSDSSHLLVYKNENEMWLLTSQKPFVTTDVIDLNIDGTDYYISVTGAENYSIGETRVILVPGVYTVTNDFAGQIIIDTAGEVKLDLCGHKITGALSSSVNTSEDYRDGVINVKNGNVTVTDSSSGKIAEINGNDTYRAVYIAPGASVYFENCNIVNARAYNGAAIWVEGGSLKTSNLNVSNCTAPIDGIIKGSGSYNIAFRGGKIAANDSPVIVSVYGGSILFEGIEINADGKTAFQSTSGVNTDIVINSGKIVGKVNHLKGNYAVNGGWFGENQISINGIIMPLKYYGDVPNIPYPDAPYSVVGLYESEKTITNNETTLPEKPHTDDNVSDNKTSKKDNSDNNINNKKDKNTNNKNNEKDNKKDNKNTNDNNTTVSDNKADTNDNSNNTVSDNKADKKDDGNNTVSDNKAVNHNNKDDNYDDSDFIHWIILAIIVLSFALAIALLERKPLVVLEMAICNIVNILLAIFLGGCILCWLFTIVGVVMTIKCLWN